MKHGRVIYRGQQLAVTESVDGRVQLPGGALRAERVDLCDVGGGNPEGSIDRHFGFITWRRGPRFAAWTALGGLPCALVLAAYHLAAFGHPLKTGYDFVYLAEFAEGMRVNYGIHAPKLAVTA